jgi:hypothetical protein
MNKASQALLKRLSGGSTRHKDTEYTKGFVETLAKAYETARNALEYRAENLVRRAAIERILKRLTLIYKNPDEVAENLLTELKWARYLDRDQTGSKKQTQLVSILNKYLGYKGIIPAEWIIKIASAEIEEMFSLNKDYHQFTFYAFQAIKQKVNVKNENLDLLVYFSVDKIYAASDPEQIAYHIISLAGPDLNKEKMEEGWKLFNLARTSELTPRINKYVRRQMPPLVLLRDMYFYNPQDFGSLMDKKEEFLKRADEVLQIQLSLMSGKISTAGVRSVLYVFLTKMVLAFGVEVPLETLIYSHIQILPLVINLLFPPLIMAGVTSQIKIPPKKDQEALIQRTYYIVENFENLKDEDDLLEEKASSNTNSLTYLVFSGLYAVVFLGIFIAIYYLLDLMGFKFFNKFIFVFFMTIIAFFAYRIGQIAQVYSWKDQQKENTSLKDMFLLPILTIGSRLSQGLTHLNFLGFVFDFILEAPFKIILGFVDDWVQFLSTKKEQQVFD